MKDKRRWLIHSDTEKELDETLKAIEKELTSNLEWDHDDRRLPDGSWESTIFVWEARKPE